jgi:DNA-binding NarL/FixJ family response regulator
MVLLDLKLTQGKGACSLPWIRAHSPRTKVILLVDDASHEEILAAISHGAQGYLGTTSLNRYLVKAVRTVHGGETWVPRKIVGHILDRLSYVKTKQKHL